MARRLDLSTAGRVRTSPRAERQLAVKYTLRAPAHRASSSLAAMRRTLDAAAAGGRARLLLVADRVAAARRSRRTSRRRSPSIYYFTVLRGHVGARHGRDAARLRPRHYPRAPRRRRGGCSCSRLGWRVAGLADVLTGGNYMYRRAKPVHDSREPMGPGRGASSRRSILGLLMLLALQWLADAVRRSRPRRPGCSRLSRSPAGSRRCGGTPAARTAPADALHVRARLRRTGSRRS